jgi:preprotein translocase subunit SecG
MKQLLLILGLFIGLFICLLIVVLILNKNIEGLSPAYAPGDSSPSSGSDSPPISTTNVSSSPLERFTNALAIAFQPTSAPAPSAELKIATPEWTNVKLKNKTVDNCKNTIQQTAVETLPIDKQSNTTVSNHSVTVNSILDKYEERLTKLEKILNNPKQILSLNSKTDFVVNLGIPTATVVYDKDSNSLINLSVVKGETGDPGVKGDQITGTSVIGDIGKPGLEGTNPLNLPRKDLPYWAT